MKGVVELRCRVGHGDDKAVVEVDLPEGWISAYHHENEEGAIQIDDGDTLCERHAPVAAWFSHNCPGCVSSFPECGMASYMFEHRDPLTEAQLDSVESGVCPVRTNGTFMSHRDASGVTFGELDYRGPAAPQDAQDGGKVFRTAINEYIEHYAEYYARAAAKRAERGY